MRYEGGHLRAIQRGGRRREKGEEGSAISGAGRREKRCSVKCTRTYQRIENFTRAPTRLVSVLRRFVMMTPG